MFSHRIARLQDLPAIVDIYNSTIPSRMVTADTEPVSPDSRRAWFDEHTPDRYPLWVVEEAGQLVGWLSYSPFRARPAYVHTAEVSIYVHEAARGRGLGSSLLTQAIAFAPRIGLHTLVGLVFSHNLPSLKLFERFGFARWADMPRIAEMDGIERDLIIVGKRVG
ncbi:MAG TPA: GNAT family N-acetyltransferase [Oxalicibacterium sp.]|nr:GNAT family N-acetyltransferase [Oxalicibacterium sp.]